MASYKMVKNLVFNINFLVLSEFYLPTLWLSKKVKFTTTVNFVTLISFQLGKEIKCASFCCYTVPFLDRTLCYCVLCGHNISVVKQSLLIQSRYFLFSRQQFCIGERAGSIFLSHCVLLWWILWAYWIFTGTNHAKGANVHGNSISLRLRVDTSRYIQAYDIF